MPHTKNDSPRSSQSLFPLARYSNFLYLPIVLDGCQNSHPCSMGQSNLQRRNCIHRCQLLQYRTSSRWSCTYAPVATAETSWRQRLHSYTHDVASVQLCLSRLP